MLGAIVGDIAGSPYEGSRTHIKTKDFPLFCELSCFTDDTVTTLAVAAAILEARDNRSGYTPRFCDQMIYWCRKYPLAGYGKLFIDWFMGKDQKPYNSYGNGASMRVSPAGWAGKSLEESQCLAELSAVVTHNHPEAVRGAVAVASAIFLARKGKSKEAIKTYLQDHFYPLEQSLIEIAPAYTFSSRTGDSVPQAIQCFLESTDFEDAIRNAVALGGDSDTQAAIAGSIAEAFYGGVPDIIWEKAEPYLPTEFLEIIHAFQGEFMR